MSDKKERVGPLVTVKGEGRGVILRNGPFYALVWFGDEMTY